MPFEFIDNNAPIDRASRKRIRSRAATGKNANRTLVRAPKAHILRNPAASTPFKAPTSLHKTRENQENKGDDDLIVEIGRPVDDGLEFPIRVHPESRYLVREGLSDCFRGMLRRIKCY
jgi:hypothetical protein